VGFVMDDILLYSLVASSRNPSEFVISDFALSLPEPYGIMMRRDDPGFKKVVDGAMTRLYKSGEAAKLYERWFLKPVPPKNLNLNVPLSAQMKNLFANPTDSPDPTAYK
jgi:glutamate/aspartate transport system substrate-binding protein